jgi:hypothetical protein
MIISASRRTDIPSQFSDWFFNRIRAGFAFVRNPFDRFQVGRVPLSPDIVDAIVFWTKNPAPMLDRLGELKDYMHYFQFTITPYDGDVEPNLPSKEDEILPAFKRLSDIIGPDRVIWRCDPILVNQKYTQDFHIGAFGKMAHELRGYTKRATISFIDVGYRMVKRNMKELKGIPPEMQIELAPKLADIARSNGMAIDTCAEKIDLQRFGVEHARCIDDRLLERLLGRDLRLGKDKAQRADCGCVTSVDIGAYDTCKNGCLYCYANHRQSGTDENAAGHDPLSPFMLGDLRDGDRVTIRG